LNRSQSCGDNNGSTAVELPVMSLPEPAVRPASKSSYARRFAAAVMLSGMVFVAMWIMAFSMMTSLLIGAGCCVLIVTAGSLFDLLAVLLDAVATVAMALLAAVTAIVGLILSLFNF
jgi:hypothetical protein